MTPIFRAVVAVHQRARELVEDGFPVSARHLLTNTARPCGDALEQAMKICEAFALILDIADRRGVRNIAALPGCWEFRAGDWLVAVNGDIRERTTTQGDKVPPFHALAVRDRASAFGVALITPVGGTCAAGVEDDLIAALREELDVGRG